MPAPKDPEKREQWIAKKRANTVERWANPEQRKKMIEGMNRPEVKKKKSVSMQGKNTCPKSEEHKANLSASGKIAMNRPEVKKKRSISARIAMNRLEVKEKLSGDKNSSKRPEVRKKLSISHQGKKHSEETKAKIGVSTEKMWQDPEYISKQMIARNVCPNKAEIFLDGLFQKLFPNEYKFVGDGKDKNFIIAGKVPDFVNIAGQKKIIELFGEPFHEPKEEQQRINLFAQYGYQTLVIWYHELKDMITLQDKLLVFMGK